MSNYPKAPKGSSLDVLFTTLERAGVEYAGATSRGGSFYCPLHPDSNPSFDVNVGSKGFALFRCAPCAAAFSQDWFWHQLRERNIGWKGSPLFDASTVDWGDSVERIAKKTGKAPKVPMKVEKRHIYRFEDGTPNIRVVRMVETLESFAERGGVGKRKKNPYPQTFVKRSREWVNGLSKDIERTPYGLEFFDGWKGLPIWVVEGEKTAEALWEAGVPATTFPGGANAPTSPGWTRFFTGFKLVLFGADRDAPGVGLMRRLEAELTGAGLTSGGVFVTPESFGVGGDAADFLGDDPRHPPVPWLRKHLEPVTEALSAALAAAAAPKTPPPAREGAAGRAGAPRAGGGKPLVAADAADRVSAPAADEPVETEPADPVLEGLKPYGTCARRDPAAVAEEFLDRHYGGVYGSWRNFGGDRWGVWDTDLGHFRRYDTDLIRARIYTEFRGALETGPDGDVAPMVLTPKVLGDLDSMLGTVSQVTEFGPGSLRSLRGAVPFRNGVLDVATRELVPAAPSWDLWWSLPFEWSGEKESVKTWFAYLDSIGFPAGSEERRFIQQLFGYILAGRGDIQKIVLLKGQTRSGKGTVLRVLNALLGTGAVPMTLSTLTEQFGLQEAVGAAALIFGDVRFARHADKEVLEKLLSLSGGDSMPVDVKYGKPKSVNFELGGRILMGTNEVPSFVGESSSAIGDRFLVLEFPYSFLGKEDPTWEPRIHAELPGIVRWALAGLDDLGNGAQFAEPASGAVTRKQIKDDSAPIRLFVEERCELGVNYKVKNEELYLAYSRWCELNNIRVLNSIHFARDLLTAFAGQIDASNASGVRVKRGVRLRG